MQNRNESLKLSCLGNICGSRRTFLLKFRDAGLNVINIIRIVTKLEISQPILDCLYLFILGVLVYLYTCILGVPLHQSLDVLSTAKPSGFAFAAPSGAPSPFTFGAAAPSSSAATSAGDSGASAAANKPLTNALAPGGSALSSLPPYQFGAASSTTAASSYQTVSTTSLAPSPFTLPVNTVAPAKTTAPPPYFMANAAGHTTTPAGSFSFGPNTASTAGSAATAALQFAPQNTGAAGSLKPQPQAPMGSTGLFQFGPANTAAVTTAATKLPSQTFSITSTPASSSSEAVKPFAFNAGSAQGFSFAPAKPAETAGGMPSFTFGGSASKPEATFPGFAAAAAQPSSSQPVVSQSFSRDYM